MLKFYKNTFCLNVLANSIENARDIYEAAEGCVAVGVLSANYDTVEAAVIDMNRYCEVIDNNVSIGLGGGNPKQADMVVQIATKVSAAHINQAFTKVGETRALALNEAAFINAMVSPSGIAGQVIISVGPLASEAKEVALVPIETAVMMIKDMGGSAIKFFPMNGLKTKEEYLAVAKACAKHDLILEPTGGLDLSNLKEILQIALDTGVKKIIPHVYSSIINKESGATNIEDVKAIMAIFDELI